MWLLGPAEKQGFSFAIKKELPKQPCVKFAGAYFPAKFRSVIWFTENHIGKELRFLCKKSITKKFV